MSLPAIHVSDDMSIVLSSVAALFLGTLALASCAVLGYAIHVWGHPLKLASRAPRLYLDDVKPTAPSRARQ